MSSDAVREIQKSLNLIRSMTEKEQDTTKIKILELMTQAILSQLQALEPNSSVNNTGRNKNSSHANLPKPLPIPKPPKAPSSASKQSAPEPNMPTSTAVSAKDINNIHSNFMSSNAAQTQQS